MNVLVAIIGVLYALYGAWLIPSTDDEAKHVQAPYRCVRGVLWMLLGLIMFIGGMAK